MNTTGRPARKHVAKIIQNKDSKLTEKRILKIYKDEISENLWNKYIEALELGPGENKSCIKVVIAMAAYEK